MVIVFFSLLASYCYFKSSPALTSHDRSLNDRSPRHGPGEPEVGAGVEGNRRGLFQRLRYLRLEPLCLVEHVDHGRCVVGVDEAHDLDLVRRRRRRGCREQICVAKLGGLVCHVTWLDATSE